MNRRVVAATLLCLLIAVMGCQRGPRIVPVSGVIKLDGKPVKNAAVMFLQEPGGRIATGITDDDGRYSLATHPSGDGAFEGTHAVTVTLYRDESTPGTNTPEGAVSGSSLVKLVWLVPEKYSRPDQSGLTANVSRDQQQYDFDLTTK